MATAAVDPSCDIISSGELAIQESEGKQDGLVQSKDKAQLAATTAMSIVNIALLKHLLDQGPAGNRYYTVVLVLVCVSLGLQCLVGLLSLCITNLQAFYRRYNSDSTTDMLQHFCHCRCVDEQEQEAEADIEMQPISGGEEGRTANAGEAAVDLMTSVVPSNGRRRGGTGLCCCKCTTRVREDYEYYILSKYHASIDKVVKAELHSVRDTRELQRLNDQIQALKDKQLELREELNPPGPDAEQIKKDLVEVQAKEGELMEQKAVHEAALQQFRILQDQFHLLQKYVAAIKKKWVLEKVTFWQNGINYMLYTVFILSAFVTGLGLAGSNAGDTTGNVTASSQ